MKAPISYYGGKQRIASKIIKYFPIHSVYVEPFCGGAAGWAAKPMPNITNNDYYIEVLNDLSRDIINFYFCLREYGDDFIKLLEFTPYSESEHAYARENYQNESLMDKERARLFYINIQQSFANILDGAWGRSKLIINTALKFANHTQGLYHFLDRMKRVQLANEDFENIIKRWDSPSALFYCDPPYIGANCGFYKGFSESDFERLCNLLDNCSASFILSSYLNDQTSKYIRPDWEYIEIEASMSACGKKEDIVRARTEGLWIRLNKGTIPKEIVEQYKTGAYNCFEYQNQYLGRNDIQMKFFE